jgi:hypothetical protein
MAAANELQIGGMQDDRVKAAREFDGPGHAVAVDPELPFTVCIVPDEEIFPLRLREPAAQLKEIRAAADELRAGGLPEGTEARQIIDGFEEIGFALAILAPKKGGAGRKSDFALGKVPEIRKMEAG